MASFGAEFTGCVGSVGLAATEHGTMVDVNRVYFDANVGMDCTSNNLAWCSSSSYIGLAFIPDLPKAEACTYRLSSTANIRHFPTFHPYSCLC